MGTLHHRRLIGGLLLLLALTPAVSRAEPSPCAGVTLPASIELGGRLLSLNGTGKRTATAFNVVVYVAGLYLPATSGAPDAILAASPKHLELRFVRKVKSSEMAEALDDGVKSNVPADELEAARKKMKQVVDQLPALKKGIRLGLTHASADVLEVRVDGQLVATLREPGLAELLFKVWLGSRPPDAELRDALLGRGSCR
jgi:hypothetical protein